MVSLLTQCLTLLLPSSQQQHFPTRRSVLHGAVTATFVLPAAAVAADVSLGSTGISSYEKLKLDTANTELAEAIVNSKDSVLKPGLDAYADALKSIAETQSATKDTASKLDAASSLLQTSATSGTEALVAQAASIEKLSRSTVGLCGKPDVGPAAVAATKLADELIDLSYAWTAAVRPLQEVTIGQPDLKRAGGYLENPEGILGSKKGGML